MAAVASAVDSGTFSHRIDYEGDDEVGVLAEAFDHMLDRLERAFAPQRDFVSDASHELRSPLTAIRGRMEAAGRETPATARYVEAEADELNGDPGAWSASSTTSSPWRRLERGRGPGAARRTIGPFFEGLADGPHGLRHYSVESSLHGDLEADPDRLAQVLRNLVTNAVSHTTADGHIDIAIASENGSAVFAVSDDGGGSSPTSSCGSSIASTAPRGPQPCRGRQRAGAGDRQSDRRGPWGLDHGPIPAG